MEEIPYMQTVGNLPSILAKIRDAGTPPKFTYEFLKSNLGFSSSGDRGVIKVLKALGFLTSDGTPTPRYNEFRAQATSGSSLAAGLREGWAPIFLSDQKAHEKSVSDLTGTFKSVTGKGDAVANKMATTFKSLASQADWTAAPPEERFEIPLDEEGTQTGKRSGVSLHHDVHIHLPPSSDVAVYTAIFRALREELLD